MPEDTFAVIVYRNGEQVVTIETNCLSGRDIDEADCDAIRTSAYHLLAFIGETPTEPPQRNEANDFFAMGVQMPGVTE